MSNIIKRKAYPPSYFRVAPAPADEDAKAGLSD